LTFGSLDLAVEVGERRVALVKETAGIGERGSGGWVIRKGMKGHGGKMRDGQGEKWNGGEARALRTEPARADDLLYFLRLQLSFSRGYRCLLSPFLFFSLVPAIAPLWVYHRSHTPAIALFRGTYEPPVLGKRRTDRSGRSWCGDGDTEICIFQKKKDGAEKDDE
jgi:hypothetical protein